jgi:amino acid transporter
MSLFMGMLLVLGMMILIFLGPEWIAAFTHEVRGFKKAGPHS